MTMLPAEPLPTTRPADNYRSYLVRFWQSNEAGCWRASAHCVQTDSTVLFADVASLLAFLQAEVGSSSRQHCAGNETSVEAPKF